MTNEHDIFDDALRNTASSVLASLRRSNTALGYASEHNILSDPRLEKLVRTRITVSQDFRQALNDAVLIVVRLEQTRLSRRTIDPSAS